MTWRIFLLLLAIQLGLAPAARAGILFWRKKDKPAQTQQSQPAPPQPSARVTELIHSLKSDPSEARRTAAAEDLRQHDIAASPEILPALLDALQRDPKPDVRAAAAHTLGRTRPVAQEVGIALEQAAANDSARQVRSQARTALNQYQRSGYRKLDGPSLTPPPGTATTTEPPLAEPPAPRRTPGPRLAPTPAPTPPRAQPLPSVPTTTSVARPMPSGPPRPPLVPADPPRLQTPPGTSEGPALTPP